MSSAASLWESFIIMIVCIFCSIVLIFAVLMPGEYAMKQVQSTGIQDVPQEWQSIGNNDYYIAIGYWLTYFLSFYGVGQFVWTAVRRQRYDAYGNVVEEY